MSWIIGLVAFLVFGVWMGVWLRFKQLQLLQDIREAVTDYVYDDTEDDTEDESSGLEVTDDAVWVAARIYNERIRIGASHPAAMHAALTAALAHLQGAEDDCGAVPEEVAAPPSHNLTLARTPEEYP